MGGKNFTPYRGRRLENVTGQLRVIHARLVLAPLVYQEDLSKE